MYFTEQFKNNPNCAYIKRKYYVFLPNYSHKNTKPAKGESGNCLHMYVEKLLFSRWHLIGCSVHNYSYVL